MENEEIIAIQNGGMDAVLQNHPIVSECSEKNLLIDKLNTFIGRYETTSLYMENERHHNVIKKLIRVRREFESTRFFVLVVGPVKSGKSSFVNILARNTVSPTDVTECTAIPTIIGKSNTEAAHWNKIVSYIPKLPDINKEEVFDDIIDVLRGIADPLVFEEKIERKVDDCNEDNLKRIVTISNTSNGLAQAEPILATIGIDETPFINDEIMVIDMPGLDGGEVNWDNNPLYARMVKRADFIFFVQSSTTAINESSVDFLRWLLNNKETNVPLRLIHNEHDSLYFLKEDIRKSKIYKQVEAAKRFILANISNQHDLDFSNYVLNLAKIGKSIMASQEICEDYAGNLEKVRAEYETKEKEIVCELKNKRLQYKEQNCINKSIHHILLANHEYGLILQTVLEKKSVIDNVVSQYKIIRHEIENMNISFAQLEKDFEKILESECIEIKYGEKIDHITDLYIPRKIIGRCSGEELEEHIDKLVEQYNEITLLDINSSVYKFLKDELEKVICTNLNNPLKEARGLLQIEEKENFGLSDIIDFQQFIKFNSTYAGIQKRHLWGYGPKRYYSEVQCREKLKEFKQYVKEDCFPIFFKEYKNSVVESFDKTFKKRKEDVCLELDKLFEKKKIEFDYVRNKLEQQEVLINKIIESLN